MVPFDIVRCQVVTDMPSFTVVFIPVVSHIIESIFQLLLTTPFFLSIS